MSTSKPRITITLEPRQHELLRSISGSTGQSMSAFLVELIETVEPVLERMAATFQRLKQQQDKERERIKTNLEEAQEALEPIAASVLDQFDLFLGKIEGGAAAEGATAPAAADPDPDGFEEYSNSRMRRHSPRSVTTGATPPNPPPPKRVKKTRKPASAKAKSRGGRHAL